MKKEKCMKKKCCVIITGILFMCIFMIYGNTLYMQAATTPTKKSKGITYNVLNKKKKTASAFTSLKSIKKAVISDKIKIKKKKTYKITCISKNAFKNRTKLNSVVIGKNVKKISSSAFSGDKKLKRITIRSKSLTKVGKNAFKGINKKAVFYVPDQKYNKYRKMIKKKSTGWKKTMKIKRLSASPNDQNNKQTATAYTYSVIPLSNDVCSYFYVKTDNPYPENFDFVDKEVSFSKGKQVYISQYPEELADVNYTDKKRLKVNGGYIFSSSSFTDGGKWNLVINFQGQKLETDVTVDVPPLKSANQYLIDTYTSSSMSFFEKLDAIEEGLEKISLYSGAYVLGELQKSEKTPYYGLSTSPHVDQNFYIQEPYYRNSKVLLVSLLYPFRLDSIGFPSTIANVAKTLDASVSCRQNPNYHWLMDITYHGETRSYGGQGTGGGQGIRENQILYRYSFDGSTNDAYNIRSLQRFSEIICEYGALTVPEDTTDLPELTWKDVIDTVGTRGSYIRLLLIHSIWGSTSYGYTFMYDDGTTFPGYFSNAWYDGRYFNEHEYFEKGTSFEDPDASTADIVIKNAKIPFPEAPEGKKYTYQYKDITKVNEYDASTETWSGFTNYEYDSKTQTWIATIYKYSKSYDMTSGQYSSINDEAFINACTLTREEVKAMDIDKNANSDPAVYYNYDRTVFPGTKIG